MGVRDWLNNNPKVVTGATIGVVLLVALLIFAKAGGGLGGSPAAVKDMAFFTDDDGATWFADDAKKIPPFDHNGKQAVRARVYRSGGKTFAVPYDQNPAVYFYRADIFEANGIKAPRFAIRPGQQLALAGCRQ